MQVILFENVERLGMQGDVVNVANGYYRNFLAPKGVAIEATDGNLRRLEAKRKKLQVEAEKQRNDAEAIAERMKDVKLEFIRRATHERRFCSGRGNRTCADR